MFKRLILVLTLLCGCALIGTALAESEGGMRIDNPACKTFEGLCGDADGSWQVNVSDVVCLVAFVFGDGPAPDPFWRGDCDLNGLVNISDAVFLVGYIFGGGASPCSGPEKSAPGDSVSPWLACLEYEYDGSGTLYLRHINAAFNCCPLSISTWALVSGDDITVHEEEDFGSGYPCPCLCLYDVECVHYNVPRGIYTITVNEMNVWPPDLPLEFTVDLTESASGRLCVHRSEYPWGEAW